MAYKLEYKEGLLEAGVESGRAGPRKKGALGTRGKKGLHFQVTRGHNEHTRWYDELRETEADNQKLFKNREWSTL